MKHEDAIKKIKKLLDDAKKQGHIIIRVEDIENSFPELKESDDKRIIRKIVAALCYYRNEGCMSQTECNECKLWIKKQSEQKPIDKIQLGKKYKCIASPRYSTFMIGEIYKPEDEFLCSFMNFCSDYFEPIEDGEQKPANDIEPKFHEGDWVTCKELSTAKIVNIDDNRYEVEFIDGNKAFPRIDFVNRLFYLWTIDDAKDGDILAYPDGSLVIFKYRLSGLDAGLYMGSVLLTDKIEFARTCTILNAKPATEKQRNILFKALKESGYEWDNINKEVKKLY